MDIDTARAFRAALWPMTKPLTCDGLWRIREASGERLEIIDGELFCEPPAALVHQLILGDLLIECFRAIRDERRGHVLLAMLDVRLANDTVVLPDLMVVLNDPKEIIAEWGNDGAPSLLAETPWGHTDYRDRGIKKEIYALYGVPEYWLVEPEKGTVTVFCDPVGDQYRAASTASDTAVSATIPGLAIDVPTLFASMSDD